MIHTIYSNSYEVLRAVLLSNMAELRFKGCPGDVGADELAETNPSALMSRAFERIPVIVPSAAVAEDLKRAIAEKESVCAAVDFMHLSHWMGFFSKEPLANVVGNEAEWIIWRLLREDGPGSFREDIRAEDPSCRLLNYLEGKSDRDIYMLASRIAAVFVTYATYRVDWLFDWLDLHRSLLPHGPEALAERAKLEKHPDYLWQRRLWARLGRLPGWLGRRFLAELPESLEKLAQAPLSLKSMPVGRRREAPLPGALHVYCPFVVPPLMLPILKAYAHSGRDVWFYLLNPCSEYWFDLVPQRLFDWRGAEGEHREVGHPLLADNGRSVRANIDRLWRFTAAPDVPSAGASVPISELDLGQREWSAEPAHRRFEAAEDLSERAMEARAQKFLGGFRDLQAQAPLDTHGYYLETNGPSLLNRVQDSILKLAPHLDESADADELFDPDDGSIAFLAAPTPTRELEGLADWLHAQFSADPALKPHDVLVAAPDISAAAPLIEKVFGSLSADRQIAFRIKGGRPIDADASSQALLALAKLLMTRCTADDFMAWLSLAPIAKGFNLSIDDLDVMGEWLAAAGFRYGISDAHLAALDAATFSRVRDMTLERALERLTLGALLPDEREAPIGDCAPVRGTESGGWTEVSERRGLLEKLAEIAARLESLRRLIAEGEKTAALRGPVVWTEWISTALREVFARENAENDYRMLREAAESVRSDAEAAVRACLPHGGDSEEAAMAVLDPAACAEAPVGFSLFMSALESRLGAPTGAGTPTNAVTFTSMTSLRGLPYKVVVILGLNQDCRFPGTTRLEEFDLMGAAPRAGDRDSRIDNRNVFLDLLLAARKKFLITYVCGTDDRNPLGPSIVAEELRSWLLSFAHGKAQKAKAAAVLTTTLSLNAFAARNFSPQRGVWQSRDAALAEAVRAAEAAGKTASEPVFADCSVGDIARAAGLEPAVQSVRLVDLVRFWGRSSEWFLKQADIRFPDWEKPEEGLGTVIPAMNGLTRWSLSDGALKALEKKSDLKDYAARLAVDPRNGMCGIRELLVAEPLSLAQALEAARLKETEGLLPMAPLRLAVKLSAKDMQDGRPLVIEHEAADLFEGVDENGCHKVKLVVATPSRSGKMWKTVLSYAIVAAALKTMPLWRGAYVCLTGKSGALKADVIPIPVMTVDEAKRFLALFARLWRFSFEAPVLHAEQAEMKTQGMSRADFSDFELFRGRSAEEAARLFKEVNDVLENEVMKPEFSRTLSLLEGAVNGIAAAVKRESLRRTAAQNQASEAAHADK